MQATSASSTAADICRTLALLGGSDVIKRQVRDSLDAHDLLASGLPASVLAHLVRQVALLSGTHDELERAIGISVRTYQRRKKSDADSRLSPEQSGRAWKFAEILGRATDIFGSQAEAEAWMQRPAIGLNQRRPIDLLGTPAGVEALEDHLTRLEYGVYS